MRERFAKINLQFFDSFTASDEESAAVAEIPVGGPAADKGGVAALLRLLSRDVQPTYFFASGKVPKSIQLAFEAKLASLETTISNMRVAGVHKEGGLLLSQVERDDAAADNQPFLDLLEFLAPMMRLDETQLTTIKALNAEANREKHFLARLKQVMALGVHVDVRVASAALDLGNEDLSEDDVFSPNEPAWELAKAHHSDLQGERAGQLKELLELHKDAAEKFGVKSVEYTANRGVAAEMAEL